jgi:hypothetical protein
VRCATKTPASSRSSSAFQWLAISKILESCVSNSAEVGGIHNFMLHCWLGGRLSCCSSNSASQKLRTVRSILSLRLYRQKKAILANACSVLNHFSVSLEEIESYKQYRQDRALEKLYSGEMDSDGLDSEDMYLEELDSEDMDSEELDSEDLGSEERDSEDQDATEIDSAEADSVDLESDGGWY